MKKCTFFSDFKAFITKGNIIDMAVGVIIGGAFGKIVTSLVGDIIMPVIGKLCNTSSLADLKYVLTEATLDEAGAEIAAVTINYGVFIQNILDFLIVAFCIFLVLRVFMKMREKLESLKKKEEAIEEAAAPAEPTVEEKTLETLKDIKELLEKNSKE